MLNPDDYIEEIEPWTDEEVESASGHLDNLWEMIYNAFDEYVADEKTAERKRQIGTIPYRQWENRILTQTAKLGTP